MNNNKGDIKINLKRVGSITGICVGIITICGGVVSGLSNYYGIPSIKENVKELVKEQKEMTKDIGEIKGLVKRYYTKRGYYDENQIATDSNTNVSLQSSNGRVRYSDINQLRTEYGSDEREKSGSSYSAGAAKRSGI